jgi:hypothetical protein
MNIKIASCFPVALRFHRWRRVRGELIYVHPILMAMLAEQYQADLIREARRYRQADSVPRTRYTSALTRWARKAQAALNRPKTVTGCPAIAPSGPAVACCA